MSKLTQSSKPTPKRAAYTPETATVDHGHEYPRVDVNPPFVYVYNPQRWTLLAGRVVPQLHTHPIMEGVNGVTRRGKRWHLAALKSHIEELGRTMIPWDMGPDGESYMSVVETRAPSGAIVDTYIPVFTETYAGSSQVGPDIEAYVDWIQSLMDSGDLPRPAPYIIEGLLADRRSTLLDNMTAQTRAPTAGRAELIASLESEVQQLEALLADAPRKPSRKRRTAKVESDA